MVYLAAGVLLLDQFTKLLIRHHLPLGHRFSVLPFFDISHVQNTGAAFGLYPGGNIFFIVATIIILILLAVFRQHLVQGSWGMTGLALVFGGALGNLVDRVTQGQVTDFLHFYWGRWSWPDFNVADSGITVGVILIMFLGRPPEPS